MLTTQAMEKIKARLEACARCAHDLHKRNEMCGADTKRGFTCKCPGFIGWTQPRKR